MDRDISMYIKRLDQRGVHDALKNVGYEFDRLIEENKSLRERIAKFNEAEVIAEQKAIAEDIRKRSLLVMTEKESDAEIAFRNAHNHYRGLKIGMYGSTFQYEISGAGIGTVLKIRCPVCGEERDITDYDAW